MGDEFTPLSSAGVHVFVPLCFNHVVVDCDLTLQRNHVNIAALWCPCGAGSEYFGFYDCFYK